MSLYFRATSVLTFSVVVRVLARWISGSYHPSAQTRCRGLPRRLHNLRGAHLEICSTISAYAIHRVQRRLPVLRTARSRGGASPRPEQRHPHERGGQLGAPVTRVFGRF